jgi:hypothetical protein
LVHAHCGGAHGIGRRFEELNMAKTNNSKAAFCALTDIWTIIKHRLHTFDKNNIYI